MVHRDIKEALNLAGVQIHSQHPPGAGLDDPAAAGVALPAL